MSDRLGPMVFGEHQEQIFLGKQLGSERNYGETVATIIDEEIHKYLDEAYKDTMRILQENIEVLHAMAKALMEVETINHEQIMNLFAYHQLNAPEPETTVQETPAETVEQSEPEEHEPEKRRVGNPILLLTGTRQITTALGGHKKISGA